MNLLFFFGFTILELVIVIAIIAILAAVAIPQLIAARHASRCIKLADEIKKDLASAEETAKKLYNGEGSVTDADLNKELDKVTGKLKKLDENCGGKDYSTIISQINTLTAQLALYKDGDASAPEKSELGSFIDILGGLVKKLIK